MSARLPIILRLAAVLFVVGCVAAYWHADTGFTSLIRFGHAFDGRRLPELETLPIALVPGPGYDGQFYAQLAVRPDVTASDVHSALDLPAYRERRILLPVLAHLAGGGDPWHILQIYALLSPLCWCILAWCWWCWLPEHGARGTAVWLLCLLSLGTLDSIRFALTELPMLLCLVLAVRALERGRTGLAALAFTAAGFIRETALFAVAAFRPTGTASERRRAWLAAAACVAPVALWCLLLIWLSPRAATGVSGNFDWPGFALARHLGTCVSALAQGNFDSRYLFGLIGAACFAYQSVWVLSRWRTTDPWLRLGLPFAVLFWILGDHVWHGYWAVARTMLPLTFAFNRALLAERRFAGPLVAGNLFVIHSVYRFLPF